MDEHQRQPAAAASGSSVWLLPPTPREEQLGSNKSRQVVQGAFFFLPQWHRKPEERSADLSAAPPNLGGLFCYRFLFSLKTTNCLDAVTIN